jgi:hypothetical protein
MAGQAFRRRRGTTRVVAFAALFAVAIGQGSGTAQSPRKPEFVSESERLDAIRRGHVWTPTNVAAMDIRTGPTGPGAFAPGALVSCDYIDEKSTGNSPKFSCLIPPEDKVRVKFGTTNGEVFAEVAASRLFWALGFGAERNYPVRVECRGCPASIVGSDFGTIQRRFPGQDIQTRSMYGWSWDELDEIDPGAPASERAARSALKLLAAFVQHTDSKTEQQRILCPGDGSPKGCQKPFLMIHDLGQTFGVASLFNRDKVSSVNLGEWADVPVWKDPAHCVARLTQSQTGTLSDPIISEAGRKFLADLMAQLTDAQIHDLFDVARFPQRNEGTKGSADAATVDQWVGTFKVKRAEIVDHACPP